MGWTQEEPSNTEVLPDAAFSSLTAGKELFDQVCTNSSQYDLQMNMSAPVKMPSTLLILATLILLASAQSSRNGTLLPFHANFTSTISTGSLSGSVVVVTQTPARPTVSSTALITQYPNATSTGTRTGQVPKITSAFITGPPRPSATANLQSGAERFAAPAVAMMALVCALIMFSA